MKYLKKDKQLKLSAALKGKAKGHLNIFKESIFHPFETSDIAVKTGRIKSRNNRIATSKGLMKVPYVVIKEILFNPFEESNISLITGKNIAKKNKFVRKVNKNC